MIGDAPGAVGAAQETVALALPAVAVTNRGTVGVGAIGVTVTQLVDAELPLLLLARTVK